MTQPKPASSSRTWVWILVLLGIDRAAPARADAPAGGDQHLYAYTAGRVLAAASRTCDAWDQKPPGIFFVYAAGWAVWPDARVIAVLDLIASVATALLLMRLGSPDVRRPRWRRRGRAVPLLADPGIQRSGGMYLRAQCETFVVLAVVAAIALAWRSSRRRTAGLNLGRRAARGDLLVEIQRR
jgi:hypothetical protein